MRSSYRRPTTTAKKSCWALDMTATNDLWRLVAKIRQADMNGIDRELLRPVFASFDNGEVRAVPQMVAARIRDIASRQPKQ